MTFDEFEETDTEVMQLHKQLTSTSQTAQDFLRKRPVQAYSMRVIRRLLVRQCEFELLYYLFSSF